MIAKRPATGTQTAYDQKADIPLHSIAPTLLVLDRKGKTIDLTRANTPQMLIFFSGCKSCSLAYMCKAEAFQKQHPNIRVRSLIPEDTQTAAEFLAANRVKLDYYSDYPTNITHDFNVVWHPRVFLLDQQAHILYRQSNIETFEEALQQASRLMPTVKTSRQAVLGGKI